MQTVIFPLKYEEAITLKEEVTNPPTTFNEQKHKKQKASIYK